MQGPGRSSGSLYSWKDVSVEQDHVPLAQLLHHLTPESSTMKKPHEVLLLSLGKKWGENAGDSSARSGSAFLVAFQSPLFPDAAPGKAGHASLMNGILFNTSNWAAAMSRCIAQAKCHDPGRQGEAMARAGSPAAHNPVAGHSAPQVTQSPKHKELL